MVALLIPIVVCGVLPMVIVFIVFFYDSKTAANKMKVLEKVIESGADIDPTVLMESLGKKKNPKTIKERLLNYLFCGIFILIVGIATVVGFLLDVIQSNEILMVGAVCAAVGVAFIVAYFVGKKMLAEEIQAETKAIVEKNSK
ncbi:MAG: DUF6249 domain-containing protein [Clostridium sp.]|nr:DUF6249 domain-containing protein [Bacteroides sp.]MCM1198556.1 DUF6249 domain-containing protein [Clostridium sp.]